MIYIMPNELSNRDEVVPAAVREVGVAAWVTREWSDLLEVLAARNECSKSAVIRVAIREHLRAEGFDL